MFAFRRGTDLAQSVVVAALLLPFAVGCDRPAPSGESIVERSITPEGQLENVMKRFSFALEHARTAEGAAVVSRREATHRLIPPEGDQQAYEAEVTITTSLRLAPELVQEIAKDKPLATAGPVALDGAAPPPSQAGQVAEAAAESIVEKANVSESKVYRLRFQNDRWELIDPPAEKLSEPDQLCFHYALSDG